MVRVNVPANLCLELLLTPWSSARETTVQARHRRIPRCRTPTFPAPSGTKLNRPWPDLLRTVALTDVQCAWSASKRRSSHARYYRAAKRRSDLYRKHRETGG